MNIKEAAARAGVSARALRYYEEKGLIMPRRDIQNGYRDYNQEMVKRAKMIHAYRELHFSLDEIRNLLDADRAGRDEILKIQLADLEKRRSELDHRITLIKGIQMFGVGKIGEIDFTTLDDQMDAAQRKLDENEDIKNQAAQFASHTQEEFETISAGFIEALVNVANADEEKVDAAIAELKNYVEDNFYPCTDEILRVYARSFGGDGMLAQTLEDVAGEGSPERLRTRLEGIL